MHKLDRNMPCWCGSGKKYKHCHFDFDEKLDDMHRRGAVVPTHDMIKTEAQIAGIRESAKINVAVLDYVAAHIRAGISTAEIDRWVYEQTTAMGGIPAPLNYEGFPKSVCTSIIGETTPEKKKLVEVARECVMAGLEQVKPWGFLGDMGQAVHDLAKKNGYSVVRDVGGHGVGVRFHEEPWVSYVTKRGQEMVMAPGMMFTIEPMVNMGTDDIYVDADNDWTIYTEAGMPSAQWEIQVLVTEMGHEVISW